jgi:hypothetical protein
MRTFGGLGLAVNRRARFEPCVVMECCMPPLIVWALGAVGAVVIGKWLARETRRITGDLHREGAATDGAGNDARTLVQDPVTGIYRPK